ncbi:esterase E4-like [Periplaneta americana]|uniref:esterase E4-like n=1 Tax=Periplaneta americana TaxID=6978 RepID=UPI0037E88BCA
MLRTLLLLALSAAIHGNRPGSPQITIKQGTLEGQIWTSRKGRDIFSFLGVPYAKPPVGELRFKPPEPAEPWSGVWNATQDGPLCVQFWSQIDPLHVIGDEDCLYLNVFTPRLPEKRSDFKPMAVMFWIVGGAYYFDTGNSFVYGPQFLLDHDVLLVSINYRLGPMGFLSTEDAACPGNNGLKDQTAALRWVQDNIAAFGGDPNRVTIIGQSAGASCVHFHMISPMSKGLFHRAISMSGTALINWALGHPGVGRNNTHKLARQLNCPTEPSDELVKCLKNKDAYEITQLVTSYAVVAGIASIPFPPVVEKEVGEGDEAFIPEDPLHFLLTAKNVKLVPWLMGMVTNEGAAYIAGTFSKRSLIEQLNNRFDFIIPITFYYDDTTTPSESENITGRIREHYFGNEQITFHNLQSAIDMYSFGSFKYGINTGAKLHAKRGAKVYYYEFNYRGTNSYSTMYGMCRNLGVSHGDDAIYLFPQDYFNFPGSNYSKTDEQMVDILTELYTNFAITGNPTPQPSSLSDWKPISSPDALEYAHITLEGVHMGKNLHKEEFEFWDSLPIGYHIPWDSLPIGHHIP